MNGELDPRYTAAQYRVRLYLSVDLSGSTAFKSSQAGEVREGSSPRWVTTFESFYRDFPARYATRFENIRTDECGTDRCPQLWKAVGDELVFCGRVNYKKSIMIALMAFIQTLHTYRKLLTDEGIALNLKGAAWLAAFPEPNRAVQLRNITAEPDLMSASEALEVAADEEPFQYDFLGKAIDTGFRVASFSRPERFSLSVQLARLLVSCPDGSGFDYPVRFDQPSLFKGVNGGEPYPVLYIDTMTHLSVEGIRTRERQLLKRHDAPTKAELGDYLEAYCRVVGTDEIALPYAAGDADIPPPASYLAHRNKISEHLALESGRGINNAPNGVDGNGGAIPDGEGLTPLRGQEA